MKRIIKIILIVIGVILICISSRPLAERYGDAHPYVYCWSQGDSYENIIKLIPRILIRDDIHQFDVTEPGWDVNGAKRLEIEPSYQVILINRFFLFNAPYAYALYFNHKKEFMGSACSGL